MFTFINSPIHNFLYSHFRHALIIIIKCLSATGSVKTNYSIILSTISFNFCTLHLFELRNLCTPCFNCKNHTNIFKCDMYKLYNATCGACWCYVLSVSLNTFCLNNVMLSYLVYWIQAIATPCHIHPRLLFEFPRMHT